jgi:hypothetical protein
VSPMTGCLYINRALTVDEKARLTAYWWTIT